MRKGAFCCILAVMLCCALCGCSSSEQADGRAKVDALSNTSVEDVQSSIQAERDRLNAEAEAEFAASFESKVVDDQLPREVANEALSGVVLVGDSLIEAISGYGILSSDHVVAEVGVSLYSAGPMISQAAQLYPSNIVIAFGENDLDFNGANSDAYIEALRTVVQQTRDEIPGARIFVASVLPVGDNAIAADGNLAYWSDYNNALIAYANGESDVTYIDTAEVGAAHQDMLEPDGQHYTEAFYPYYLAKIGRVVFG